MEPFLMEPIGDDVLDTIAKAAAQEALATVPASATETFAKNYKDKVGKMIEFAVRSALKAAAKLNHDREKDLVKRINELQVKIDTKPTNFAAAVSTGLPKEQRQAIASQVMSQVKQIEQRAFNVVVIGIKESDTSSDSEKVNAFLADAGAGEGVEFIRNVRRLKKGNNTLTSNLILVSLSNQDARTSILDKCRHHKLSGDYQHVFVREDRTPAEQQEFNRAREQARRRNKELEDEGLLNKPFRYVIHRRTGRVDLIDVEESSKQQRYVFRRVADLELAKSKASGRINSATTTGDASGDGGTSTTA
jgi:hypothetical protein